jgi:hypothetical protein
VVPTTLYVCVDVGLATVTLPEVVDNPVDGDHVYEVAPLTVKVAEPPLQIDTLPPPGKDKAGGGFTVIVNWVDEGFEHPFNVGVTDIVPTC